MRNALARGQEGTSKETYTLAQRGAHVRGRMSERDLQPQLMTCTERATEQRLAHLLSWKMCSCPRGNTRSTRTGGEFRRSRSRYAGPVRN